MTERNTSDPRLPAHVSGHAARNKTPRTGDGWMVVERPPLIRLHPLRR
jgi:hypothetical protein